jgi:outer membrane protein assembly factor BamB
MMAQALTPSPSTGENEESFPHFRANLQRTGVISNAFAPPLSLAWEYEIDDEVRSPTIAHGRIYFASLNSHVYALSLDGELIWRFKTGARINASLAIVGDHAYFGCNDHSFYCLDAHTGALIWQQSAKAAIQGNFATFANLVMCGAYDGNVYAFDAISGAPVWMTHVGSGVNCSLALFGDVIYLGANGGTVHALDAHTGETIWQSPAPGGINSTCVVSPRGLFTGTRTGRFCAFDILTGALRWSFDFGARIFASPSLDDDFVYIASDLGTLRKLRIEDGSLVWEVVIGNGQLSPRGQVWTSPLVCGDVVYVGPALGAIMALDRATGEKLWAYPVEGPSSSSVAIAGGVLASSTGGNRLLVFKSARDS